VPTISAAGGGDTTISSASGDSRIMGTATPGHLVTLELVDSLGARTSLGTTVATSAGHFSFEPSSESLATLPQGSGLRLIASVADAAGNTASSKPFIVNIDTLAPEAPKLLSLGGGDGILSSASGDQQLSGTALPYSTVHLEAEVNGSAVSLGSVTSTGQGLFSHLLSVDILNSLGQGVRRFVAAISDAAGNRAHSNAVEAVIDTIAEQSPSLQSVGGSDAVVSGNSGDRTISGIAAPGRPVTLQALIPARAGQPATSLVLAVVMPDPLSGIFSASFSDRNLQDLGEGSGFNLVASQPDAAGNVGSSSALAFSIDTIAPAAPELSRIGGDDAVISSSSDAQVVGRAASGAQVSLWGSNDGMTYQAITSLTAGADGRFTYTLTASELASFAQGSGRWLQARVSDSAGNLSSSYPFAFSLETEPPGAPTLHGFSGSDASLRLDAATYTKGLALSGLAPGATAVEVTIAGITVKPLAYVNGDGQWSLTIDSAKLPQSASGTSTDLKLVAINRHNARSSATTAVLRVDTVAPSILDVVLTGNTIRIPLSEAVILPASLATNAFSVRAGTRSIGVESIDTISLSGVPSLVLQLRETVTPDAVVRVSYSGNQISDALGNPLPVFNNRIVTHVSSDASIVSPNYSIDTITLTGEADASAIGNEMHNSIFGNSGDNLLAGGLGGDRLTGGVGRDTFLFTAYGESVLLDPITRSQAVDWITDLAIGTDIIAAPGSWTSAQLLRVSTTDNSLSSERLATLLPASTLQPFAGAIVEMGPVDAATRRTFVVLNDGNAGYAPNRDMLIEITGYTGNLNHLQVV
jgi:hypothetical protein